MATTAEVYSGGGDFVTFEGWPGVPVRVPSAAVDETLEAVVECPCHCDCGGGGGE